MIYGNNKIVFCFSTSASLLLVDQFIYSVLNRNASRCSLAVSAHMPRVLDRLRATADGLRLVAGGPDLSVPVSDRAVVTLSR